MPTDREPVEFEGEKITKYEASQKQRTLETAMRHTEDRLNLAKAANNTPMREAAEERMRALTHKYQELNKASGLPSRWERTVSGWGSKITGSGAKAPQAQLKAPLTEVTKKVVENSKKALTSTVSSDIIKETAGGTVTKITEAAIEKIQKFDIEGIDNVILNQRVSETLRYAMTDNESKEVAFILDNKLNVVNKVNGGTSEVELLGATRGNYIALHNHPANHYSSIDDILEFMQTKEFRGLVTAKNNCLGLEIILKTDGFDEKTAKTLFKRITKKAVEKGDKKLYKAAEEILTKYVEKGFIRWQRL